MDNKLVIELTTIYDNGDMVAKVYQSYTDNTIYYNYSNKNNIWTLGFGRINRKKVTKKTNDSLFDKMQKFFNENKCNIFSQYIISETI
jgi:hypothetical protein